MKNPHIEALKTVLRPLAFAAAIGAVEALLSQFKMAHYNTTVMYIGTAILTYVDNYLHTRRSNDNPGITGPQGILPF